MKRAALLLVVGGCGDCPPLAEVPIRSATAAEEGIAQATLRTFAEDVVLPACVDHVAFGGMLVRRAGQYNTVTRGVRLAETVELDLVAPTLRHELCHAVDQQNDLVAGREDLFVYDAPQDLTDGRVPIEAFADTCMLPREALAVLWPSDCDAELRTAAAEVVRDEVLAVSDPPPLARFLPAASVPLPADAESLSLRVTVSSNFRLWSLSAAGALTSLVLDPWTGEVVGDFEETLAEPAWDGEGPEGWSVLDSGVLAPGVELVVAELDLPSGPVERAHARRDGRWAPAVGLCPNGSTRFLVRDGALWSYQVDGDLLSWGRWIGPG